MTLLWARIVSLGVRNSVEHMPLDAVHGHASDETAEILWKRNLGGWQEHVGRMADDIREHGYSPERHGKLVLRRDDDGSRLRGEPGSIFGRNGIKGQADFHRYHLVKALQQAGHSTVPVHVEDHGKDPNEPVRYYHGTTAEGLDKVHPNNSSSGNFGAGTHEPGYAYATTNPDHAWDYADRAADAYGGKPRVYEVHPSGPVEKDPTRDAHGNLRGNYEADVRSKHHFDVLREHQHKGEH